MSYHIFENKKINCHLLKILLRMQCVSVMFRRQSCQLEWMETMWVFFFFVFFFFSSLILLLCWKERAALAAELVLCLSLNWLMPRENEFRAYTNSKDPDQPTTLQSDESFLYAKLFNSIQLFCNRITQARSDRADVQSDPAYAVRKCPLGPFSGREGSTIIWATSNEKVHSSMRKMGGFTSSRASVPLP